MHAYKHGMKEKEEEEEGKTLVHARVFCSHALLSRMPCDTRREHDAHRVSRCENTSRPSRSLALSLAATHVRARGIGELAKHLAEFACAN